MDTAEDSEEEKLSSVGDSEEETGPRVQEVGSRDCQGISTTTAVHSKS